MTHIVQILLMGGKERGPIVIDICEMAGVLLPAAAGLMLALRIRRDRKGQPS